MLQLLAILSEGKKSNVDWVKRLIEIGEEYSQGHDPGPLEQEAIMIMSWAYDFSREYLPLMPDWLCRAFKVYSNSLNKNEDKIEDSITIHTEYTEATLF